jgi:fumarate hydratase class II
MSHFLVEIFQTGSGSLPNMNSNLADRWGEQLKALNPKKLAGGTL